MGPHQGQTVSVGKAGSWFRNTSGITNDVLCPFPSSGYLITKPDEVLRPRQVEEAMGAEGEPPARNHPGKHAQGPLGQGWGPRRSAGAGCQGQAWECFSKPLGSGT